jgi:hypothetical protein
VSDDLQELEYSEEEAKRIQGRSRRDQMAYIETGGESHKLRVELCARNIQWAEQNALEHERTMGTVPAILYRPDEEGRHGNFHPASYRRILLDPGWKRRLDKTHTTARRHTQSRRGTVRTMACPANFVDRLVDVATEILERVTPEKRKR